MSNLQTTIAKKASQLISKTAQRSATRCWTILYQPKVPDKLRQENLDAKK